MNEEELYQILVSEYMATGEGMTMSVLITRAYPRKEDWETPAYFEDGDFKKYVPGVLKEGNTARFRAMREFAEQFDPFYARCAQFVSREDFVEKYHNMVPAHVIKVLTREQPPGNFHFYQQLHLNYA